MVIAIMSTDVKEKAGADYAAEPERSISLATVIRQTMSAGAFGGWGPRMFTPTLDTLKFKN